MLNDYLVDPFAVPNDVHSLVHAHYVRSLVFDNRFRGDHSDHKTISERFGLANRVEVPGMHQIEAPVHIQSSHFGFRGLHVRDGDLRGVLSHPFGELLQQ